MLTDASASASDDANRILDRRALRLGDSSEMFVVVEAGLTEGDEVVLDPLAHIEEAQLEAATTLDEAKPRGPEMSEL